MPVDVFIAYARSDRVLRDELGKQLSSLRRQGIINDWFDGDIIEGDEWKEQLMEHLHKAQIILLLISPDFVESSFCHDIEMKEAMKRHDAHEARVIPVILRPVDWHDLQFGKIQAAPKDAKPVTQWTDRDAALLDVTKRVKRSIRELQGKPMNYDESQMLPPSAEQLELQRPAAQTINSIGQVSGGSSVVQGGYVSSTIRYGSSDENNNNHEKLLRIITDLVDRTNEMCDQYMASQEESSSEGGSLVDPGYLQWFMDVMWDVKQRTISIPAPLLDRVQQVCQRLRIPCILTR